jgi:hypothetical protein
MKNPALLERNVHKGSSFTGMSAHDQAAPTIYLASLFEDRTIHERGRIQVLEIF